MRRRFRNDVDPELTGPLANVDEVFIDLCRQMLRRDDEFQAIADADDGYKHDTGGSQKRRRRKKKKDSPRCAIL